MNIIKVNNNMWHHCCYLSWIQLWKLLSGFYFLEDCILNIRVARICQNSKIENCYPLRFLIGSFGFQKVQKFENLCMLKTASLHFFMWIQNCKKIVQNSNTRGTMIFNGLKTAILRIRILNKIVFYHLVWTLVINI